ncbi:MULTISPECIES: KGK domain-containing protein [unclassified Microcoleus]|uniref:KGK domain-containing protein n=1 Tax=unclassified Microcoleus TaxID=2642155 RepID=UPI002FD78507
MEPQFEPLDSENHVFCVLDPQATLRVRSDKTYTIHDFLETIASFLESNVFGSGFDFWTKTGVRCSFLKVGSNGWVTGKVRVKILLEFAPDEPSDNAS